jgi:hypothetical protein
MVVKIDKSPLKLHAIAGCFVWSDGPLRVSPPDDVFERIAAQISALLGFEGWRSC